jgi:valyl-tRNA synthetase
MVNWDQKLKLLYQMRKLFEEQQGKLYFLKYKIEGSEDFLTIATTSGNNIWR